MTVFMLAGFSNIYDYIVGETLYLKNISKERRVSPR
jgi:hypothetical protein